MASMSTKSAGSNTAVRRILREASELSSLDADCSDIAAAPTDSDLFEWHFTIRGPPDSSYAGGIYHGLIRFPANYPFSPPSFQMHTPSGRFEPKMDICLSISNHHSETWQPAWGVRTALVALRAHMAVDVDGQIGAIIATDRNRLRMAASSIKWMCPVCKRSNDDIVGPTPGAAEKRETAEPEQTSSPPTRPTVATPSPMIERTTPSSPMGQPNPEPVSTPDQPTTFDDNDETDVEDEATRDRQELARQQTITQTRRAQRRANQLWWVNAGIAILVFGLVAQACRMAMKRAGW